MFQRSSPFKYVRPPQMRVLTMIPGVRSIHGQHSHSLKPITCKFYYFREYVSEADYLSCPLGNTPDAGNRWVTTSGPSA
ncbi:hypothetical protein RB213_009018 [Colletotrichum asianum]